jgi:DNA polymerase
MADNSHNPDRRATDATPPAAGRQTSTGLTDQFNWIAHIEAVAVAIFGTPNTALSKPPDDVRFGYEGSMRVNYRTGEWQDLVVNSSGGPEDLIVTYKRIVDRDLRIAYAKECQQKFENGGGQQPPQAVLKKSNGEPPRAGWLDTTAIDRITSLPGSSVKPSRFFADFETLSRLNLKVVGAANYLRHKRHTRPLVLLWAVDDDPFQVWRWGDPIEPLLAAIEDRTFVSQGAFDRICWNVHMVPLGLPEIPIERSEDNMVLCQRAGIPSGLGAAAKALKFPPELQKLDGRIALEMSRPREPREGEDPDGLYALDDPEKEAKLIEYCIRDGEVLRALNNVLPPLTELDRLEWICSEHTNEIGLYLDGLPIEKACALIEIAQQEVNAKLQRLTNNKIKTIGQRDKILAWLNARGAGLENLQADTLEKFLERKDLTEEVRGVAEARFEAADAAPLKALKMRAYRWEDGRAYHVFSFWGAVTGRWSSSGVQVHNVKSEGENIAEKLAAVISGDPDRVRKFGPIMKVVGDVLRAVPCARPGFRLLGMDFSGIESCVLAGLAGERWKIEQWKKFFRTRDPHDDPYYIIGKWLGFADDVARQYGKVADLAFGYGGSIGAWKRFAPAGDTTSDEQIKRYRDIWRERHPATRQYLKGLDTAVLRTVQSNTTTSFGGLTLHCQTVAGHNWLYIRLPSGRSIPYPFAEIKYYQDNKDRLVAGVGFMDYQSKKWRPYKSPTGHPVIWPGLLIENVTQGIARDLLAAALVRLRAAGYPASGHVHDESFSEVRNGEGSLEEYKSLCEQRPDWAVEMDIPVFAKVWERERWAEGVDIPVTHTPGGVITPDQLVKLHKNKAKRTPRLKPVRHPDGDRPNIAEQLAARAPGPPEVGIETPGANEELIGHHQQKQPPQGVPFMITRAMKEALRARGRSNDEIAKLTPQQAHEILQKLNGGGQPHDKVTQGNGHAAEPLPLLPDRNETLRYLTLLDATTTHFTFQTFDDDKERRKKNGKFDPFAKVLHGTLDEHFDELTRLNNLGAGVFVTVNRTNLRGRSATDITEVRYVFGDFDNDTPLPQNGPQRFMDIQSSPTGRHGYWKPNGITLDAFKPTQELIIRRFNGDPNVKDLPRVMRLPGFWHRKGEPFLTRILEVYEDAPACSPADFETDKIRYQAKPDQPKAFDGLGGPWAILNALALANLNKWVPQLFGDAAVFQQGTGAYRVSSQALGRDLEEDLSIHPKGIKDWGVADQGDAHQGGRTPIDLVVEYRNVDADAAFKWLDVHLRDAETQPPPKPWRRAPIHEWVGKPVPQPRYTVADRILAEQVFLLSGEGGTGKSSMVQQLCAAHIIAREWLGGMAQQGPGIFVECEDNEDAFWWRLATFAEYYNVSMEVFVKDLHLFSLVNEDSILAATNKRGIVEPTAAFHHLYEMAGDIKPVQIGIASVANVFAGSEINRTEVQQFLKLMNRIPAVTKGSLTLVAQPSLTGLSSTNISHQGLSGTTQWHNGVRNRAAVEHIKAKEGENIADTGLRSISFFKNQYGPPAASCHVCWKNGMFRPVLGTVRNASERATVAEELTLTLLRRFTAQNRNVSINANPYNYAPTLFAGTVEAEAASLTKNDFKKAIERLLERGALINEPFHPPGKAKDVTHYRLAIKETTT